MWFSYFSDRKICMWTIFVVERSQESECLRQHPRETWLRWRVYFNTCVSKENGLQAQNLQVRNVSAMGEELNGWIQITPYYTGRLYFYLFRTELKMIVTKGLMQQRINLLN